MRIVATLNKVVITPGKPAQIVFTAETTELVENDALLELAQMEEDTACVLAINPMQSNLPFDDVKVEYK